MRPLHALAALLFAGIATAATAAPPLWEVGDGDSHVWLFGSVHVLPKEVSWRTQALDDIVVKSTKVYFEADIGILGQTSIMLKMLLGGFKATQPWIGQLTPDQQAEVEHAAQSLGVSMDQLEGFDPWLAESILDEKSMEKLGYLPALGVDGTLQGELPKDKKAYFETVSGQFALFAKQPFSDQIMRLLASVDHMDDLPDSLSKMVGAWSTGDVDALAQSVPE